MLSKIIFYDIIKIGDDMPKRRRKKKKFMFRTSIVFVLFLVLSGSAIYYIIDINYKIRARENLKEELVNLQREEEILENNLRKMADEEYIARFARERYLYSKQGELIIRLD